MAQINQRRVEQREDPLDKITKALGIATTIWGISNQSKQLDVAKIKAGQDAETAALDKQLKTQQLAELQSKSALGQAANDPSSPTNTSYRQSLAKSGIQVPDNMTEAQINASPLYKAAIDKKFKSREVDPTLQAVRELQLAEAQKKIKGEKLTSSQVLTVNEGFAIPATNSDILQSIEQNKDSFGPVSGRLSALNPYDEKAQTLNSQFKSASQQFGKYMEGGVLRKEDEEKYRKMYPNLSDTPEVAANKLQIVDRLLKKKLDSDVSALKQAGYNTSAFGDRFDVPELPKVVKGKGPGVSKAGMSLQAPAKQDPKISDYAGQHGLGYDQAEQILRQRGYGKK